MEGITLAQAFSAASAVSSVMGAFQSMQQGAAAESQYEIQAAQARAKAEREAVNAEIEGNNVLRKLRQTNAAAVARGFSGGVSGFSGSAKLIQEVNARAAGRDFTNLQRTAAERRSYGEVQEMMFLEAADNAKSSSTFDAISGLAGAAFNAYALMPGGGTPPTTVPGYEGYRSQFNAMSSYTGSTSMMTNESIMNPFKTGPQYNLGPSY